MTRRQLFKNFGLGLAGILALPLFGKPGKASEPKLQLPGNPPTQTFGKPSDVWGSNVNLHVGTLTLQDIQNTEYKQDSERYVMTWYGKELGWPPNHIGNPQSWQ